MSNSHIVIQKLSVVIYLCNSVEKSYSHIETYIVIYLCNSAEKSYSHIETYIIIYLYNSDKESHIVI